MVKRKLRPDLLQVENFNLKIMLPLEWDGISSGKLYVEAVRPWPGPEAVWMELPHLGAARAEVLTCARAVHVGVPVIPQPL